MRTSSITIDRCGRRLRTVIRDDAARAQLEVMLHGHTTTRTAPLAFEVQIAPEPGGINVVLDRSGFILGRTRSADAAVAIAASHLGALEPPPPDTMRLRMRALLHEDQTATLFAFPLMLETPVVERRLERMHLKLVDRMAADVGQDGALRFNAAPWERNIASVPGHATGPENPVPIKRVLLPDFPGTAVSQARLITDLCEPTVGPGTDARAASKVLSAIQIDRVAAGDPQAFYRALAK